MTRNRCRTWLFAFTAATLAPTAALASGDSLEAAKALYGAASFDSALVAIEGLEAADAGRPDALVYKALCLLALGRPTDAQVVTDALVMTEPTFSPAATDLSPRFLALLIETKRRVVPVIAKRAFAEGREQMRTHKTADAQRSFQQVLSLTADTVWRESAEADDLRTLASGFLDLIAAPPAQPVAPAKDLAAAVVPPRPVSVVRVEDPVIVSQQMPRWLPATAVSGTKTFHGAVKIRIGVDGRVTEASITMPTEQAYDRSLLAATKRWVYIPAKRNGQPIEVEKSVEFYLRGK